MAKYLDSNGLLYLWQKITGKFVAKEDGKGLSTNDFTTELKNKLDGVEAGAQKNIKPDWSAGSGTAAEILNKPTIPTKTSELTNDSKFITAEQVPEGATASNTVPKMNGVATVGEETAFARGDHVHPSDTSKADVNHNHDTTYLKLSGGTMTGPITFSPDQGQIGVDAETAAVKIELDTQAAEIVFTNKQNTKTNRMTVSGSGAVIAVGEATPGDGSGIQITVDETNGVKIPMVADPTDARHAANKQYVDNAVSSKANSADVYKKTETYTQTEIDQKLNAKANSATTLAGYGITDAYTKTELDGKLSSVYKPAGNCLFANLPQPSASNLGNVYSMMDAFTTDDRFVASQPTQYPIGTNVAVVQVMVEDTPTYLFDVLAGFVDLSGYMKKTDMVAITNQEIDEIAA